MKIITITHLFLLSLLFSCVGTVNETAVPKNKEAAGTTTTFNFAGLQLARAVSHNRIEVEFQPLAGKDHEYFLYINDSKSAIKLDPNSLFTRVGGRVLYLIEGLKIDTEYKLKLTAVNTATGSVSFGENTIFVKTFDNPVANFSGVTKIELTPGNRTESIDVRWLPPKMTGTISADKYDPVCYQITYISEVGGAANLNNKNYTGNDRDTFYVPNCYADTPVRASPTNNPGSTSIPNLKSNTRYYVQVRAIHKEYQTLDYNGATNINVPVDSNTKYLSIKTDPKEGEISFELDSLILANAPGSFAIDQIDVTWLPGQGIFNGYRLFYKKYTGSADPFSDPILSDAVLETIASDYYKDVPATDNAYRLTGLEPGSVYQVRVAMCKQANCPLSSAIISDFKAIRVEPKLASFSGINSIDNPGAYSQRDMVNLNFNPPVITDGYATELKIFCVNPLNHTEMVEIPKNEPLTGSIIPQCNNLYLEVEGTINLAQYSQETVKNIIANGKTQYCFAASPAIVGHGADVVLPEESRVVRCSYPEVKPPTIEQFPGISNNCSTTFLTSKIMWPEPMGGIYSGFQVFWKEKVVGVPFSFADATDPATAGATGYFSSPVLDSAERNYEVTNLMPGRTYQFGVLGVTDLPAPTGILYSEYNTNILECRLQLPMANFEGFTRIFAIGPKVDGTIPNAPDTKAAPLSARLFEAINRDGIPYEIPLDSENIPNLDFNIATQAHLAPPGTEFLNYLSDFDGRRSEKGALSKDGIISLAWEEVDLPSGVDTLFLDAQSTPTDRPLRQWGYRVYRSHDNKLTWQNVTDQSGLLQGMNYSYRKRPNDTELITSRMIFFTDYSVRALEERHDASNGRDIDRARIYYYKIVPIFDGKELPFSSVGSQKHIVKVTLPPPNMALVHRWMANRSHCLSMNKSINTLDNYSCDYNGLGSVGKDIPFLTGKTKYDQSGDLLIDRFELGCRFTRGDISEVPSEGLSHFDANATDEDVFPLFRGYRSIGKDDSDQTPFKGCIGHNSLANSNTPGSYQSTYQRYLHGDCTGSHANYLPYESCTPEDYINPSAIKPPNYIFTTPGLAIALGDKNCSEVMPSNPSNYLYLTADPNRTAKFVMQSEFLAVYHNRYSGSSSMARDLPVWGPAKNYDPDQPIDPVTNPDRVDLRESQASGGNQCAINLASIDGSGYMRPRWISLNKLNNGIRFKDNHNPNLVEKTVNQITEVVTDPSAPQSFYNGQNFKVPGADLQNSPRYRATTQIGRIIASNSAKLPPLGNISQPLGASLCATNWVEVGIANESSQFAVTQNAKHKRLVRRPEFVTASAWPEHYDTTKIAQLESANVATTPGSCMNLRRNFIGEDIGKGNLMQNWNTLSAGATLVQNIPLHTGSSPYRIFKHLPDTEHSQWCTSKYGVQDLIGNNTEVNSERIFCDYSQDQMFIGPVQSSWPGSQETQFMDDGDPQFELTSTSMYNYILYDANGNETFEIRTKRWNAVLNDWEVISTLKAKDGNLKIAPWVKREVQSGYCSVVNNDASSRPNDGRFTDGLGYWKNIFLPGGAVNPDVVMNTQRDQQAVKFLRNGDGFFADFGPSSLFPSLKYNDTLGLFHTPDITEGKYFNPIYGFPLKCADGSCENDSFVSDNTNITVPGLAVQFADIEDEEVTPPLLMDFPVGNSRITNTGLSTFTYTDPRDGQPVTAAHNTDWNRSVLVAININEDGVEINREYKNFPQDWPEGSQLRFFQMYWNVARGTVLMTVSGGSTKIYQTGRYTASVQGAGDGYYNTPDQGARCAILINED